ncbi:MAG: ATP-binding protein [Gemmatimonadota bacterium]
MRTRTPSRETAGDAASTVRPDVYPWIVRVSAGLVVGIAAAALIGWVADAELLFRWGAGLYPIMPLTILAHLLAGAALAAVAGGRPGRRRRMAAAGVMVLIALLGAGTLVQYLFGIDIGLGRVLFPEAVRAAGGPRAGEPAFNSGTGFLAAGLSLLLLLSGRRRGGRTLVAQLLAAVVLVIALVALLGYVFAVEELYTVGPYAPMSVPSAFAFLLLAVALLFMRPADGFMRIVTADDAGGYAARRLLPATLLLPAALGWLRLLGQEAGLFGTRYGLTLMVTTSTVLLAAIAWWSALVLHRFDAARARHTAHMERERSRLGAILDALPVGVVVTDPGGRFTLVNEAFRGIWGADAPVLEDAAEHGRYLAWWPGTDRRLRAEDWGLAKALREGARPESQEVDIETFDGKRKTVLNRARVIRDSSGRITGGVVAVVDITDRRRAESERERARAEAERRARQEEALRLATAAVAAAFTPEEVIDRIARSALAAAEADTALVERIDPEREEAVIVAVAGDDALPAGARMPYAGSLLERVIRLDSPVVIDDLLADPRTPPHLRRAFGASAALAIPMSVPGEPIGALILVRAGGRPSFRPDEVDGATAFANLASVAFHKVRLLEESETRRAELRRLVESQSRLVRGFSHDVKNPLGAADGRLALLEEGALDGLDESQREEVGRARRSLHTAIRLIGSLVDFARAEAGQVEIESRPTDVGGIVREIAEEQRPAAREKGLTLDVDVEVSAEPIRADPDRLRQISGNLVSNAIKYTDEGGVRLHVVERDRPPAAVEAVRGGERSPGVAPAPGRWVAIEVADTGPGIPEGKQNEIFDEFTRLDPEEGHGAGLGLAISRRLARLLGGDITVESEVGRGSTFTVWLPREGGERTDRGAVTDARAANGGPLGGPHPT